MPIQQISFSAVVWQGWQVLTTLQALKSL
jgi:hypothetical protein